MTKNKRLPVLVVALAMVAIAATNHEPTKPQIEADAVALTAPVEGGFQLTASLPANAETDGDAVVVVTTRNCAEPKNARVSGRVVTWGDEGVSVEPLELRNVGEGRYAIDRQWTAKHVLLVFDGSYTRYTSGLLIGLDAEKSFEGQGKWVGQLDNGYPTQLLDRHVREKDVNVALARMRG